MTKHTALDLPDHLYERLSNAASQAGKRPEELIVEAVHELLEDLEDHQAIKDYERDREAGTLGTISLQQLSADLGLDD